MQGKKYKRSRHAMLTVYQSHFAFRPPIQTLVDPLFCAAAYKHRCSLEGELGLERIFGLPSKPMISTCCLHEVQRKAREQLILKQNTQKEGDDKGSSSKQIKSKSSAFYFDWQAALQTARNYELRTCKHPSSTLPSDCILNLLQPDNPNHYAVAVQDSELREKLRHIPGIPLLLINKSGLMVMERPSEVTMNVCAKREKFKLRGTMRGEMKVNQEVLLPTQKEKGRTSISKKKIIVRKRRAKGPNPLSVKKSKKTK